MIKLKPGLRIFCSRLESVTIPDSVTSIGLYAFDGCSLETIRIGTGIKSLPQQFSYYYDEDVGNGGQRWDGTQLTSYNAKYYYNGDIAGWLSIDGLGTTNDKEKYTYAYDRGMSELYINDKLVTDLVIPDGVTEIKRNYFDGFGHQFDSITIPRSVTKIEPGALAFTENYEKVVDIYYQGTMQEWMNMDYYLRVHTDDAYNYYSASGLQFANINLYIDGQLVTDFVIPDGIEEIPDYKFYNFNFSSVSIPDSVKSIGDWAFVGCTGLESVTIGDNVTSIGEMAFQNCSSLTSVKIPNNVTSIGGHAFNSCGKLTSVTIGDSVTSIGEQAFVFCGKLTSVTIGDSVTTIGDWAFGFCDNLTTVNYKGTEEQWNEITGIDQFGNVTINCNYTGE